MSSSILLSVLKWTIIVFTWTLFTSSNIAHAACDTLSKPITTERKDILVSDMSGLFESAKGCVTVIELWASWCGPCVKIAPEVAAFHKAHPEVAFISISADATVGAAEKFWKANPPIGQKYRLNKWSMAELQAVYASIGGTFPEAIPYFVVLDANGTIQLEVHEPKNLNILTSTIDSLTNGKEESAK